MGRGARRLGIALANWIESWRACAPDYDPAYYQAFWREGADAREHARVFAALGADPFLVQVLASSRWQSFEVRTEVCSCGGDDCEHLALLDLALTAGLCLQRFVAPRAFAIHARSQSSIELRAQSQWPPEVGPRFVSISAEFQGWTVRAHETGQKEIFVVAARCSCGAPRPCLHEQLVRGTELDAPTAMSALRSRPI
jgi:hypothetical protein